MAPVASSASLETYRPPSESSSEPAKAVDDDSREDPGTIAPTDAAKLAAATKNAEQCFRKAKAWGKFHVKIVLADDGKPKAWVLLADDRIPAKVAKCAVNALEQGRYASPGTTKHFFLVRIDARPDPQEYQVD